MNSLNLLLENFKYSRFHTDWNLLTWHPRGVFTDDLADAMVDIIELEESVEIQPFNRFTDLSGLDSLNIHVGHIFRIAEKRREVVEPVKSAFFADTVVGFGIARMYESLMQNAFIQVRAFRFRSEAANWLKVPVDILEPEWGPIIGQA